MFAECDVGNDGILHYQESIPCWQLIESDEYMLYKLLHEKSAMLNVYGVCGNMYAVQYAAAEPFLGYQTSWSDGRDWNLRARLAIALMEMVEEFEETPYGTFYLCDVQEPNFGVVSTRGDCILTIYGSRVSFFGGNKVLVSPHNLNQNYNHPV